MVNPVFDVPLVAEVLPSGSPPVKGEDMAFVVALEMPPGAAGAAVGAGLPNESPGPPQMKKKFKALIILYPL